MKSRTTESFAACFAKLPLEVQEQARRAYALWLQNPLVPGLQFKRIYASNEVVYSVRIGLKWRALGLLDNDVITWFWIGSHAEYDELLKHL